VVESQHSLAGVTCVLWGSVKSRVIQDRTLKIKVPCPAAPIAGVVGFPGSPIREIPQRLWIVRRAFIQQLRQHIRPSLTGEVTHKVSRETLRGVRQRDGRATTRTNERERERRLSRGRWSTSLQLWKINCAHKRRDDDSQRPAALQTRCSFADRIAVETGGWW
jgi:hypothetical protein